MILAANIGVVDEIELMPRLLDHLERIGVDQIVVTDTGSVDGTADFLRAQARRGRLTLIEVGPDDPDPFDFANRMLRRTLDDFAPDWVLFGDADEFCLPRGFDLPACLAASDADVLQVERLNVPVGDGGACWPATLAPDTLDRVELVVRPVRNLRGHLQDAPETPWILGQVMPKIIARAGSVTSLGMGAHAPAGATVRSESSPDLVIAHLPITDEARFRRKVANIRAVFARFADRYTGAQGWHWKRWLELDARGALDEEYRRQVFDAATLARLRADGTIASAAAWFAANAQRSAMATPKPSRPKPSPQ